jgi:VWFA-related protein
MLFSVVLAAQTPGGGPGFRTGTQEVLVDAVVLDKKGNFQRDLTQQDFRIWEDGKEQKITSISLESAGVPGHGKHFISLVFESEREGLREEVKQFVDRYASPDLYLAVFSRVDGGGMRLQQAFTPNADRIKAAIRDMPEVPSPREANRLQGPNAFLDRIGSVVPALAPVRGRKALILFSYGLFGDRSAIGNAYWRPAIPFDEDPWLKMFGDCNAANVSVYSFQTDGRRGHAEYGDYYGEQTTRAPDGARRYAAAATDLLRGLATRTGGKYTPHGTYDLANYLGSVLKEQNEYYLLGFVPEAESAGKPCHKLKVKVERSGLEVDARDGYCTSGQFRAPGLNSAQRALEARTASGLRGNTAVGVQLSWFHFRRSEAVVDIAADIDPGAMKMRGRLHGEFNLLGIAYRQDGSMAARFGDTVELDFDTPAQLSTFLKTPYHYSKQFSLAPGEYRFRMAVGSSDQTFGSAEKPLNIEPWSGQTMSASGIALSARDYALSGVTAELDNSMLEGSRRLASKGRLVAPMGGSQFRTGQDGFLYVEVYEPRLAQGQVIKAPAMRIRVVDRGTRQEKSASGPIDVATWIQTGNPVIPIALKLPISNLPAGSYTVELSVTDEVTVVRSADFEVK